MRKIRFFRPVLASLPDNNSFDQPWGCYLINLTTLLFTLFEISKHHTFAQCFIWNVLELPN